MTIFVLIMLTSLDGSPVWVETDFLQIMRPAYQQCHHSSGAAISVGGRALCVKETPDQIRHIIEETKR